MPKNKISVYFTDSNTPMKFADTEVTYLSGVVGFAGEVVSIVFPLHRIRSIITIRTEEEEKETKRAK